MKLDEVSRRVAAMNLPNEVKESVMNAVLAGYESGVADGYNLGHSDGRANKPLSVPTLPMLGVMAQLHEPIRNVVGQCPDCGNLLEPDGNCYICRMCGYTKCF